MKKANCLALFLVAALWVGAATYSQAQNPAPEQADAVTSAVLGQPAPDFVLKDHEGKPARLSDMRGKIVVLEWFNPDCPFVKRHYNLGTMKALADRYREKGVVWLAVNTTHYLNQESNKKWVKEKRLPYRVLDDSEGEVGRLYAAKTTPHMFIIDKKGTLVYAGGIDSKPVGNPDALLAEGTVNYVDKALSELTSGKDVAIPKSKPYGCSVKYAPKK
ncbi:redoxin domain-containing protein [bacterium]|nr:redoxin domain-containing protein [bacterium]